MTVLYAPFYYVISIKFNSLEPGGKDINPPSFTYQFEYCIHSLFFNNLVIIPKPLSTDGTFENSKEEEM